MALGAWGTPSCTWASLGHVQARLYPALGPRLTSALSRRWKTVPEMLWLILSGLCRYKIYPQSPPAQAYHLTKLTSCLMWRGTPDVLQTLSFPLWETRKEVSSLQKPLLIFILGRGQADWHPQSAILPAPPALLHSLPTTTGDCGMWPSPPCGIPGSQGRCRAEPSRHGRLPAEAGAAGRQRAAGLAGRTAQEAPAPEVTALLSDPSHIRWLPCLSWQQASTAPSGCHWRAAPPLLFFWLLKKKHLLIWREKCPATFPMHSSGHHFPCLRQQWGVGMSGMEWISSVLH